MPTLTLRYSSENGVGDGPFGIGWKLELGEIRRSFRFGIPSFDDGQDAFGNPIVILDIEVPHREFAIDALSQVTTSPRSHPNPAATIRWV